MSGNDSPGNPASETGEGPPSGTPGEEPPKGDSDPTCLCPLGGMMDLLNRKYAMQVVCVVGALGPARYHEIEAAFGEVSSSTLSTRLEELTESEFLVRTRYEEAPPRVEYELTDEGEALAERLEPLLAWVEQRDG